MCMKFILFLWFTIIINDGLCGNKYSKEANIPKHQQQEFPSLPSLRTLDKPFRMAKLNLLWSKAQHRLTEVKLKSLFGELKIHDKEEITWKRMKTDSGDKEGLKEAELRKKLIGIMSTYDLLEHFDDVQDPAKHKQHKALNEASEEHINKSLFKDKKLNKLWVKAEQAGFNAEEMKALKEEFGHHQDKIDQYFSLLRDVEDGPKDQHENSLDESLDRFNMLERQEEGGNKHREYQHKANQLREKHRDLRDGYDRLYRLAAKGPNSKEFVEPKVQGLWKIAVETDFTPDELESLRIELLHYENRLLKLRHLQAEAALNADKHDKLKIAGQKHEGVSMMEENLKKQERKVEKLHVHLEAKIMQKHVEL